MHTEVQLTLDEALVAEAERRGPLDEVVAQALALSFDPARAAERQRWAEDNALLVEAAGLSPREVRP